jgi:putative flippase GtrA
LKNFFEFRFVRFLLVGGLNSLIGFTIFSLLAYSGAQTWQALLGGNIVGIAFNFFTIGGVVFRDMGLRRIPLFVLAYIILMAVNLGCIRLLYAAIQIDRIPAQALLTLPMAMLSYLLMSKLVFSQCRKLA